MEQLDGKSFVIKDVSLKKKKREKDFAVCQNSWKIYIMHA